VKDASQNISGSHVMKLGASEISLYHPNYKSYAYIKFNNKKLNK
jgi:hypothetical protein